MTVLALARTESMPGFSLSPAEIDEVHTPSSDYSFGQSDLMSSSGSGMFSYCQTVQGGDLGVTPWDATADGPQNLFADQGNFYHGESEDYALHFGQVTPTQDHPESLDDFPGKWTAAAAATDVQAPKAEPMRRRTSKSSNGSHRHRTSKKSTRSAGQSALSQTAAQLAGFDMTGNASGYHDRSSAPGRVMNTHQYLVPGPDALAVTSAISSQALYPDMMDLATDGLNGPYFTNLGSSLAQHVDPSCTQMVFSHSPNTWESPRSDRSSPNSAADDAWSAAGAHVPSPPDSQHTSPELISQSPRDNRAMGSHLAIAPEDLSATVIPDEYFVLPPSDSSSYGVRRQSNEGESARDHALYKNVMPKEDGLFHCPFEGSPGCSHKPEKLKCNYDKFVDSHLKPYRCKHEGCENTPFSSTACLLRHEREAHAMHGHGDKPYLCTYEGCDRALSGSGFPRQWNLRDHMRRVHNDNGIPQASLAGSPSPAGPSHSAKGRKRKSKDSSDSSSGRKSSSKANAVADSAASEHAAMERLVDRWYNHRKALQDLLQDMDSPDDPNTSLRSKEAHEHLESMDKLSRRIDQAQKAAQPQPMRRSSTRQSG